MKEKSYYISIDSNLKIIRYKHSGLIFAEDINDAWEELLEMKEFVELKYNLFSDYRDGKFKIEVSQIKQIVDFLSTIELIIKGKRQAIVVDDPYSVAGSMLFQNEVYKEIGFLVKVFSTEQAAMEWLNF